MLALAAVCGCSGATGIGGSALPFTGYASSDDERAQSDGGTRVTGPIVAVFHGGYTIKVRSGCGSRHEDLRIYRTRRTALFGPRPAVGRELSGVGTGSCRTSLTARTISTSTSTASITVAGPIAGMYANRFTISVTSGCGTDHSYLTVYQTDTTTMTGSSPAVGLVLQATGTGSCTTSVTATSIALPASASPSPAPSASAAPSPNASPGTSASPSPIPSASSKTFSSTVYAVWTGGFTLNPQGGYGYLNVHTNASTFVTGGGPKNGAYVQATGSGALSSFTASSAAFYASAPSSISLAGTAGPATAYGFTLNAGSQYPAVPIVMDAATVVAGARLVTGASVKVTGLGAESQSVYAQQVVVSTPSPSPGASATPTPSPIAQKHILTADYLGYPYGTTSVTPAAAEPYLTWAQTGWQDASAISAAGIKTQNYVDPNRTSAGTGDQMYTSDETTFAHDCSGNRVTQLYGGTTLYQMNIGASSMQSLFASFVTRLAGLGHFDALFEDDAGALSDDAVYAPFSAMPCGYTDSEWLSYGQAIDQASSIPVIFNGLNVLHNDGVSQAIALLSANATGGNYEHCYSDDTTAKMTGWLWTDIENTELEVAAAHKYFGCELRNSGSASAQTDSRLYALASFLLTYDPATSVLWEQYATTSGLHVMPESQLVTLDPLTPAPASVASLQVSGGAYGRQYAQCYLAGKFVGSCVVVVNPLNGTSVPFPWPQYTHTLALSGSGVLDGGTVSSTGPAPPVSVASGEAVIAFP